MKRLFCTLSAAVLALTCCACNDTSSSESTQSAAKPVQKTLVTLGDSIAAGYGLENAEDTRYSALLTDTLTQENITWRDCNYAVSGDTAAELMQRLNNGRAVRLPSADVITISIGANNMLQPFGAFYGVWLKQGENTAALDEAFTTMESEITAGLADFEAQLPQIYKYIRDCNTEGMVIIQTVYNPFADSDVEIKLKDRAVSLAAYAEEQIAACNHIISDFIAKQNDEKLVAADIHAAFAAEDSVPVIGAKNAENVQYLDPHPNAEGHEIIAAVIADIIQGAAES